MKDKEEDRIPLGVQIFRLLIPPNNGHCSRHNVDPPFEGNDLKKNKEGCWEIVKAEMGFTDLLWI